MTTVLDSTMRGQPVPMSPSLIKQPVGSNASEIVDRVKALQSTPSPGSDLWKSSARHRQLPEQIFDALANVKIMTLQVAMHLDSEWRRKLFRQLDSLHDIAEWESGDEPVQRASFSTFLKAMLNINPKRRPGLGLSQAGNLVAAWTTDRDRLTIEFLPQDSVRWVLSRHVEHDEIERFAGETKVDKLWGRLTGYNPEHWFS